MDTSIWATVLLEDPVFTTLIGLLLHLTKLLPLRHIISTSAHLASIHHTAHTFVGTVTPSAAGQVGEAKMAPEWELFWCVSRIDRKLLNGDFDGSFDFFFLKGNSENAVFEFGFDSSLFFFDLDG